MLTPRGVERGSVMKRFIVSFVVVLFVVGLIPSMVSAGFKFFGTVDPVIETQEHTPPSWRELFRQEVERSVEKDAEIARLQARVQELEVYQVCCMSGEVTQQLVELIFDLGDSAQELLNCHLDFICDLWDEYEYPDLWPECSPYNWADLLEVCLGRHASPYPPLEGAGGLF